VIFDTDVLIWCRRGNSRAAAMVDEAHTPTVSAQTYMELLQGSKNKEQLSAARSFLKKMQFSILPITPNISHRAMLLVEEHALRSGFHAGDALVAATALEHNLPLATANLKHFKPVHGLKLVEFRSA
jgi:predicted nucleic acid-binding protein